MCESGGVRVESLESEGVAGGESGCAGGTLQAASLVKAAVEGGPV